MAGSRAVEARMRLAKRLTQQRAAVSVAARCQDGVDSARVRAEELAAQGASLIAAAEQALAAAIRELVEVMGSTSLAAAVLDLDETTVRKAVVAHPPRRVAIRPANSSAQAVLSAARPDARPRQADEVQAS